jgi:dTDP-4-dehydrorhamnose reductase
MLGHQLHQTIKNDHEIRATLRQDLAAYDSYDLFDKDSAYANVDARSLARLTEVLSNFRPEVVVNCVGLVKQRDDADDEIANLEINALLPHRLAELCRIGGARLIHISTDCVFSGRRGMYDENDVSDATDLYGRTKYLGEISGPGCLTLRTSMIGRELARKRGLVEWFLAQRGVVRGFRRAIFSGFATTELSRIIKMMIERFPDASGVYHVSAEPIDKFTLLELLRDHFGNPVEIAPDDELAIDRSLASTRFRREFAYAPPTWRDMVATLVR